MMTLENHLPNSFEGPQILLFTTSTANHSLVQFLSDDYNFEICMRKLSLRHQVRVRNKRNNRIKDLVLRLFTKIVLNYIIYVQGGVARFDPWAELPVAYNKYGKPYLRNQKELNFQYNSSSSNDIISIVVLVNSQTSVGIDLSHEAQDAISSVDFMDQFQGIFSKPETDQLMQVDDISNRYVAFNHFWTLKEALTKFIGCGLNVDLSKLSFLLTNEPLKLRDAIPPLGDLVSSYDVEWVEGIEVDYSEVAEEFKRNFGQEHARVYCSSGVLRLGDGLPVIVSIITSKKAEKNRNFHINMEVLLAEGQMIEG